MPRRKKKDVEMVDCRHEEKRPNYPEAGSGAFFVYPAYVGAANKVAGSYILS